MSGIKFLQYISGNEYEDLKKEYLKLYLKSGNNLGLSASYSIPNSEPSIFNLKSVINPDWKNTLSEKAKEYLEKRKVLSAPFLKEPLYSCYTKNKDEYIMIPWKLNGVDAYYQLNDFQKLHSLKYIFPKNKTKLLYGLDNIDISWKYILVFEGVYDSLFVKNGIACGTKKLSANQLNIIKERYPNHQIVIAFDNDIPGLTSIARLLDENNGFKYFLWFNQNTKQKDINDYVLFKNNVNMFIDPKVLEKFIIGKLSMRTYLLKTQFAYGSNTQK